MSVRCGNCRNDHDTVADVKSCYGEPANRAERLIRHDAIKDQLRGQREQKAAYNLDDAGRQKTGRAPKDGFYTVEFEDGEHRTIRLRTQASDARFAPGETIASFLSGPMNESDYTGFAFVKPDGRFNVWRRFRANGDTRIVKALQVVLQDPKAPAELYAQESGNCYRCNRTLTVPESIDAGIGPHCREMVGVA